MRNVIYSITLLAFFLFVGCSEKKPSKLPIIGYPKIVNGDTIQHTIPDFSFVNQDSQKVDNQFLSDNIYIADFFFTSCPSICPKVKKQMLRIHDEYKNEDLLKLVSYTLDPKRDNVEILKMYSSNLGVDSDKWHFLTGDKGEIFDLADDYFVVAKEDPEAPGGFDHSGKILLVDKDRHVRAFAEGTDPEDVTEFISEIAVLIDEYKK